MKKQNFNIRMYADAADSVERGTVNFISKSNHALEACDHDAPSQL